MIIMKDQLLQGPTLLTLKELINIAMDVAKGCCILEQARFIHRDIAARNCLVSSKGADRVVKIGGMQLCAQEMLLRQFNHYTIQTLALPGTCTAQITIRQRERDDSQSDGWHPRPFCKGSSPLNQMFGKCSYQYYSQLMTMSKFYFSSYVGKFYYIKCCQV